MKLSDIKRKVTRAVAAVEKRQTAYDNAPRGKRTEARAKLTEARGRLREVKREFDRAVRERERQQDKADKKARELAERARKAREALRKHLEEDRELARKEREAAKQIVAEIKQVEPEYEDPTKPRFIGGGDIFQDEEEVSQPDPDMYPGRKGVGAFLLEEGWDVEFYPGLDDFDARKEVFSDDEDGFRSPLSGWRARDNVWWRAEITFVFDDFSLEAQEAIDALNSGDDASLSRGDGKKGTEAVEWRVTQGTAWHSDPAKLDGTVNTIIRNIESKYKNKAKRIWADFEARGRDQRPQKVRRLCAPLRRQMTDALSLTASKRLTLCQEPTTTR